jgi:p-aminobenzoyl-glutamate transporter AbgT
MGGPSQACWFDRLANWVSTRGNIVGSPSTLFVTLCTFDQILLCIAAKLSPKEEEEKRM